jgi:hypothetical protein
MMQKRHVGVDSDKLRLTIHRQLWVFPCLQASCKGTCWPAGQLSCWAAICDFSLF